MDLHKIKVVVGMLFILSIAFLITITIERNKPITSVGYSRVRGIYHIPETDSIIVQALEDNKITCYEYTKIKKKYYYYNKIGVAVEIQKIRNRYKSTNIKEQK